MADASDKPATGPARESPSGAGADALPRPSGIWGWGESITRNMSRATSVVGIIGLIMLVLFTVIDVLGSKVFSRPFPGYTGVTELAELTAMSFAMGITFLAGQHIKVEIIIRRFPPRAQAAVNSFISLLGLLLFVLIVWRMVILGMSFQASGEVVDQIYIPLYPFPYAVALAFVPVSLALLYQLGNSLRRMVRR